jgi:AraC-like DNA-binding protein
VREALITNVLSVSTLQYLVLAALMATRQRGKLVSHRLLAAFLLAKALTLLDWLLYRFFDAAAAWNPHIFVVGETFVFLLPPLLYLYTRSLLHRDFALAPRHLVHAIPFALAQLFLAFRFYPASAEAKRQMLSPYTVVRGWEATLRSIIVDVQFLTYVGGALLLIAGYQRALAQSHSTLEKTSLVWLRTVLVGYTVINLPFLAKHFIYVFTGGFNESLIFVHVLGNLAFVTALVVLGLHHSQAFAGLEPPAKYGRALIPEEEREQLLAGLRQVMERDQPFLEPSLTLQELAGRLSVSQHQLSQVLNDGLGQSFYDFVNGYRVRESQRRLARGDRTVLEVLYESGFSSKSTFNATFKKHTGMTPTQYRSSRG